MQINAGVDVRDDKGGRLLCVCGFQQIHGMLSCVHSFSMKDKRQETCSNFGRLQKIHGICQRMLNFPFRFDDKTYKKGA